MNDLKVLIVGGGGREHALAWKISQSNLVKEIYCAPGNGGTDKESKVNNLNIAVDDFPSIAEECKRKNIDLVVVGPDNPLADGIVDYLEDANIDNLKVFGPRKEAAKVESSKSHAKDLMAKIGIPTARYKVFTDKTNALEFARQNDWARVVKADGLAFGKGVFVCSSLSEVEEGLVSCFDNNTFGESGSKVIIEEKLVGEELSIFLLCDGKTLLPLAPSQDHKRRFEEDKGPNTGGMGAYSPVPLYEEYKEIIDNQIVKPLDAALKDGTFNYKGVLFIGILIANDIPYVLEFNARFGDPEAQAILPRLQSDLVPALIASCDGTLDKISLDWDNRISLCVVLAGKSYPASSSKGKPISINPVDSNTIVFHAGTKRDNGQLLTNGGRVLAVTGLGDSFDSAKKATYKNIDAISFEDKDYRKDIGWRIASKCQSI